MPKTKVLSKVKQELDLNYQHIVQKLVNTRYSDLVKTRFIKHSKVISNAFFVQKAILKGASNDLPYQTLVIVGELLSHPGHQKVMEQIIEQNVLKSKGEYLKLDDPYQQGKIRKALKTFQFEVCDDLQTPKVA